MFGLSGLYRTVRKNISGLLETFIGIYRCLFKIFGSLFESKREPYRENYILHIKTVIWIMRWTLELSNTKTAILVRLKWLPPELIEYQYIMTGVSWPA